MKALAINISVMGLIAAGASWALANSLAMPEVHVSHSTGECVRVINSVGTDPYTCENLPRKYHHVWVK